MTLAIALYVPNAPNLIDPALFGGAGARTVQALRGLQLEERERPGVVVVVSPHWWTGPGWQVNGSERPDQIYDFSGFRPALGQVRYRPPGDPALAARLAQAAQKEGLPVAVTEDWGLDHGAWAPLMNLLPGARVPVVPLSIARRSPEDHLALGRVLGRELWDDPRRVLLVATGSITHRLDRIRMGSATTWVEGARIEEEITALAIGGRGEALLTYPRDRFRTVAPEGELLPLFTLLGAIGPEARGKVVSTEQVWQAAGMTVMEFHPPAAGSVPPVTG